jgi:uncharacterized damage-inducible protein DinB
VAKHGAGDSVDISEAFLQKSRGLLVSDYLPKIERCLDALDDADVWWRANEASNSIGNLVLHLCGNVTQWIIGGVGGRPYERHRQEEFDERTAIAGAELLRRLRAVVKEADQVIDSLNADDLLTRRQIQDDDVTVLEAIYHVVEHFGMHTGQIILLSKARTGIDLKLWQPPHASSA